MHPGILDFLYKSSLMFFFPFDKDLIKVRGTNVNQSREPEQFWPCVV